MDRRIKLGPILVKPDKINNYTYAIALLKRKQMKYKNDTYIPIQNTFSNMLSERKQIFNTDSIIEGFLHRKLSEQLKEYREEFEQTFQRYIDDKIKEIKEESRIEIYRKKLGSISEEDEKIILENPDRRFFSDELFYHIYENLRRRKTPIDFLHSSYLKYLANFRRSITNKMLPKVINEKTEEEDIRVLVQEFAKIRFNREEYSLEIYDGRALWAEVFVFYRLGKTSLLKRLLNENDIFFEFMGNKFRTMFMDFLDEGVKCKITDLKQTDDKFKVFLFSLVEGNQIEDSPVISTIEDYLWLASVSKKDIKAEIDDIGDRRLRILGYLLTEQYEKGADLMLKSDLSVLTKFAILKEICFERNLVGGSEKLDAFGWLKDGIYNKTEDTAEHYREIGRDVSPIFVNFLFIVASGLQEKYRKVQLIEMLSQLPSYYDIVPIYVVKYKMYNIISGTDNTDYSNGKVFGYSKTNLDKTVSAKVVKILKNTGRKTDLLKIGSVVSEIQRTELIGEVIENAILSGDVVQTNIILEARKIQSSKLCNYVLLYDFYVEPTIENLKKTVFFTGNTNTREYRKTLEKLFPKAVDVTCEHKDVPSAGCLFRLCGELELNEECSNLASRDLFSLI